MPGLRVARGPPGAGRHGGGLGGRGPGRGRRSSARSSTSRRARTVTLIAGGFGETEGGREAEARVRKALAESHRADDGGVLLNGGNCLGIISAPGRYSTFFIPPHKLPVREGARGGLASISQSGAYLVSQISNLDRVVTPRYAISFGNQMDVTVSDYLAYLEDDAESRVFAVYLEGFQRGDGARFPGGHAADHGLRAGGAALQGGADERGVGSGGVAHRGGGGGLRGLRGARAGRGRGRLDEPRPARGRRADLHPARGAQGGRAPGGGALQRGVRVHGGGGCALTGWSWRR